MIRCKELVEYHSAWPGEPVRLSMLSPRRADHPSAAFQTISR